MGARAQHTPAYRKLCRTLRALRNQSGQSQRALAEKLRKPPSYVHKVEVGDRRIDPVEFISWCKACGKEPSVMLASFERSL